MIATQLDSCALDSAANVSPYLVFAVAVRSACCAPAASTLHVPPLPKLLGYHCRDIDIKSSPQ